MTSSLLGPADPHPFTVHGEHGGSAFVLIADHAGRAVPTRLGDLGVSASEWQRHIAWDIGIAETTRLLAQRLDAWAIAQTYSRLVIDCNRPPESPQSIVIRSERTDVPGNVELSERERAQRRDEIFAPYHERITRELDARNAHGRRTIVVTMHSFTPVYMDNTRAWHAGVLFNRDRRLADLIFAALTRDASLVVGENEPYAASEQTDYALIVHGERRGLPCVEIEIRQDLIAHHAGQAEWAARVEAALRQAEHALFP